jgi:hypothetical protein
VTGRNSSQFKVNSRRPPYKNTAKEAGQVYCRFSDKRKLQSLNLKTYAAGLCKAGLDIYVFPGRLEETHNAIRGHKSSFQQAIEGIELLPGRVQGAALRFRKLNPVYFMINKSLFRFT